MEVEDGSSLSAGMTTAERNAKSLERQKASERLRLARLLDGHVSRKVVKQTVMTTVYGVTLIGAKDQIYNRLWDLYKDGAFDEEVKRSDLPKMAMYLAKLTLDSLDENFKGATQSMKWLVQVAGLISRESKRPVEWVTPLGWPVLQPYFKIKKRRVRTIFHDMTIIEKDDFRYLTDNTHAPIITSKQKSALPPNYVHSLDSSHMLLSARRCREEGLTFAAVHDSYWTHACSVDRMNELLREEFVHLHKQATLEGLFEQLKQNYPEVNWDNCPPPPPPGDLDIELVKESTYFFS